MKILFLVQKEQRIILDRLYDAVAAHSECDLRWLSSGEQANLRRYFRENIDVAAYERIVFFLRFKKEIRQPLFIRSLPNLVILEHDAWQDDFPGKYQGKFSAHYRRLPAARVLASGWQVTEKLKAKGVDAVFVPKGYDPALLANRQGERDIELGFVGSIGNDAYSKRKVMLEAIRARLPLVVARTKSGEEYAAMLNRIRFFVSADVGMGEYMIKNFEAMACGCVLCAWDQGETENRALGFGDMENLVLYRNVDDLTEKIARLRAMPERMKAIAAAGQALVEREYRFDRIGERIVAALVPPLRPNPLPGLLERLRLGLRL
ncbi:MAG: glycosyltransferase [Zoogloeaceae bacterium]|jgi:glycosyltransferase involved in cell wall biosynthesis|nr:glycosyltransferase [Zoogloeaceae bacterium]